MKARSIVSIIFLLYASLSLASQPCWYIYGALGEATQMDWYRRVSNKDIHLELKRASDDASTMLFDQFKNRLFAQLTSKEKQAYQRLHSEQLWGDAMNGGLGCQLSPTFSIEAGYSSFFSPIQSIYPFSDLQELVFALDLEKLKIVSLQGIHIIGKKAVPITRVFYGYGQCGLGLWVYNQAENDAEVTALGNNLEAVPEMLKHLAVKVPLITSVLIGLGVQINLNFHVAIDVSWLYLMQTELSPFHIVKAGVKISL